MLQSAQRRAQPMDLGPAQDAAAPLGAIVADSAWVRPIADTRCSRRRRPGRRGGRAGDAAAGVRRRAAAPAAAPARRADPARGAALAGQRGGGAAGDVGRLGQQRAAARAGDDRRTAARHQRPVRGHRRRAARAAGRLRRRVRALRHRRAGQAAARRRRVLDAAVPAVGAGAGPDPRLHARHRREVRGLAAARHPGQRRPGGGDLQPRRRRASAVGDRRAGDVRRARSPGCITSSTPSCSPTSGCPPRLDREDAGQPDELQQRA